jgi:hypothetical protein
MLVIGCISGYRYRLPPQSERSKTPNTLRIPRYGKRPITNNPAAYLPARNVRLLYGMMLGMMSRFESVNTKNAPILKTESVDGDTRPPMTKLPERKVSKIR